MSVWLYFKLILVRRCIRVFLYIYIYISPTISMFLSSYPIVNLESLTDKHTCITYSREGYEQHIKYVHNLLTNTHSSIHSLVINKLEQNLNNIFGWRRLLLDLKVNNTLIIHTWIYTVQWDEVLNIFLGTRPLIHILGTWWRLLEVMARQHLSQYAKY